MILNKKFIKKLLSGLLFLIAILLVACEWGGGNDEITGRPQKASPDKQIFVEAEAGTSNFLTLDPALCTNSVSWAAIEMIFTGLVQLDQKLQIKGQLAQSWHQEADGITWTFHLKPNLKFSDGTPLTSKDVAYSLDRALQPALNSPQAYNTLFIKDAEKLRARQIETLINDSIKTPDENTIVITASTKGPYFLNALTYPTSHVVEKNVIDKWGTKWTDHLMDNGGQGGAGPFKVFNYSHSKGIIFVSNATYYGLHPQLRKVTMSFYPDIGSSYKAYQVGKVDSTDIPQANYFETKTRNNEFHKVLLLILHYFAMNYLVKPFDNIHIRQAFALALNKNLIEHAVRSDIDLATNHIIPQGMPGYNPNLRGLDGTTSTSGNPAQATALLEQGLHEEGWSNIAQIPPIKFTYYGFFYNEAVAAIQMWQNVLDISVIPNPVDPNTLLRESWDSINNPKGLQLWAFDWFPDYPDPQAWLTVTFGKGTLYNPTNYGQNGSANVAEQQLTQQLLAQADISQDQITRMQQYHQAEQQLVNDAAWVPIYQEGIVYLLKPYVKGMVPNPLNLIPPDEWSSIYIAMH